jgi:hypothetical protein
LDSKRRSERSDCPPIPGSAFGPAVNEQGYCVGRVEGNLYWVTDGTYQSAFLTTSDGVVLFDAPPTIGHNIQRAVDEIAAANGVSNEVTHLIYSHHHADHAGGSSLFDRNVARIGHEETRKLLLRDDDPARPAPEETFQDRRTLEIAGERIELAWHGSNHSPGNNTWAAGEGLSVRDYRRSRGAGHREVHGRSGARRRLHGQHHVPRHSIDPPRPGLRVAGSPVSPAMEATQGNGAR